jgi:hypothetical protein
MAGGLMVATIGIAFMIASGVAPWGLLPANGQVHRLATTPFVESIIPLAIVAGFAVGTALVFAGVKLR